MLTFPNLRQSERRSPHRGLVQNFLRYFAETSQIFFQIWGTHGKVIRQIDPVWEQVSRSFTFVAPPLNWIFGGKEPSEEQVAEIMQEQI